MTAFHWAVRGLVAAGLAAIALAVSIEARGADILSSARLDVPCFAYDQLAGELEVRGQQRLLGGSASTDAGDELQIEMWLDPSSGRFSIVTRGPHDGVELACVVVGNGTGGKRLGPRPKPGQGS